MILGNATLGSLKVAQRLALEDYRKGEVAKLPRRNAVAFVKSGIAKRSGGF